MGPNQESDLSRPLSCGGAPDLRSSVSSRFFVIASRVPETIPPFRLGFEGKLGTYYGHRCTDHLGRDCLSRAWFMWRRISLLIGVGAALISGLIGTVFLALLLDILAAALIWLVTHSPAKHSP